MSLPVPTPHNLDFKYRLAPPQEPAVLLRQQPSPLLPPADPFEYYQLLLFCLFRLAIARLVPKRAAVLLAHSAIAGMRALSHIDISHF